MNNDIFSEVKSIATSYKEDSIEIVEGLSFCQYANIRRTIFYSRSKYVSSDGKNAKQEMRPFYNIVNKAVNVGIRATDFDTKNIEVVSKNPNFYMQSFFARKELEQWMHDVSFDLTLNKMSETRVRFGTVLVKRVETKDQITVEPVSWKNVITDQVDILNNPIIEEHYLSPLQFAKKRTAWSGVETHYNEIMSLFDKKARTQEEKGIVTNRIKVYEIQGELPKSFMPDAPEDTPSYEHSLQKHFLIAESGKDNYLLHSEELKDGLNYKMLHWEEVEGRGQGKGMVEDGYEAQMWTNDSIIREKEVMEIASKIFFKTTDDLFADNIIKDLNNGDIFKLDEGDISQVNTVPNSLPQFGNQRQDWDKQYTDSSSTYPGITGEQQPANTPLGSVQLQRSEAKSIFDYKRQQMGIFLEDMIEDWVLPYLMKKINRKHILNSEYSEDELDMIDTAFATYEANKTAIDKILDDPLYTSLQFQEEVVKIRESLAQGKNRRYIEIPEGFFSKMDAKVRINTTNEKYNKQVMMQSMTQLLSLAPQLKESPELLPIFSRVIEMSGIGISPSEITPKLQPSPLQPQPQGDGVSTTQAKNFSKALQEPTQ